MARRRVAIAGGGTAGHVTTGLAIMDAYRKQCDAEVYFIGCPGGWESRLVPANGFALETVPGRPFARQNLPGKAKAVATLVAGIQASRSLLRRKRPELVIGLGSYGSPAPILAARSLGIPIAIHEANIFPGIANRLASRFADLICVGWEASLGSFPGARVAVTGIPVVPSILELGSVARSPVEGVFRILLTGGSEGSPFLNEKAPEMLAALRSLGLRLVIRHQTGLGADAAVRARYAQVGLDAKVESFIEPMSEAYAACDFVIATAGAATLAELATLGMPSLLVPSRTVAEQHQTANAIAYAEATEGLWQPEETWDPEGIAWNLAAVLHDPKRLGGQGQRARTLARPSAARDLVLECERMLAQRVRN